MLAVPQDEIDQSQIKTGEKIFQGNCTACHNLTGYTKLSGRSVGPDLSGVTERREMEWLKKWIYNNKTLRESGDADASMMCVTKGSNAHATWPFALRTVSKREHRGFR